MEDTWNQFSEWIPAQFYPFVLVSHIDSYQFWDYAPVHAVCYYDVDICRGNDSAERVEWDTGILSGFIGNDTDGEIMNEGILIAGVDWKWVTDKNGRKMKVMVSYRPIQAQTILEYW